MIDKINSEKDFPLIKIHFPLIHSTNSWAKEHIQELNPLAFTAISADEQSGGRGRFQRQWVSPKGCNIYVSYVFFLKNLGEEIGNIPQLLAVAAYETLQKVIPQVKIKWPNDLVVHEKKLGGILCEVVKTAQGWGVIVGIGININMPLEILKTIDRPATSLMVELGQSIPIKEMEEELSHHFRKILIQFFKEGFTPFLKTFKNSLIHKKDDLMKLSDFTQVHEGHFQRINADGSLTLKLHDGVLKRFVSGELL